MPRFVKTNPTGNRPIYIRDDVTVIFDDHNTGEINFYAPDDGRIVSVNKRPGNITVDDFLPQMSAGTRGFIKMPIHWITEKHYGDVYIRPEAVTYLAATSPQPLTQTPGMTPQNGLGVRMLLGLRGLGQTHNYGVPPAEYTRIFAELRRARPDLLQLAPRDAVCATMDHTAVMMLDTSQINRMKVANDRVIITYSDSGAIDLKKPPLDKDALLKQAIGHNPAVNNPASLSQIWKDAQRAHGEDLEALARGIAREAKHLIELRNAITPYFTVTTHIARLSTQRKPGGGGELTLAYTKPFSPVYDAFHETVAFKTDRDLDAAVDTIMDGGDRKLPTFSPPRPPRF